MEEAVVLMDVFLFPTELSAVDRWMVGQECSQSSSGYWHDLSSVLG